MTTYREEYTTQACPVCDGALEVTYIEYREPPERSGYGGVWEVDEVTRAWCAECGDIDPDTVEVDE